MNIPDSMRQELQAWNNGKGIDLRSWIGCEGSFSLAVGYADVYWPGFVRHRGYVLKTGFSEEHLQGFERQPGATRRSVEWVMNHLHIGDIHYASKDFTQDKAVALGSVLQEIYRAKLAIEFPALRFVVEFFRPADPEDLLEYQLSFWQEGGDSIPTPVLTLAPTSETPGNSA